MSAIADTTMLYGRGIVAGVAEGEALVTRDTISGWGGIDADDRHDHRAPARDCAARASRARCWSFPAPRARPAAPHYFHLARVYGAAPKAMVFTRMTTKIALGAVVTRVPAVTDLDGDPFALIETGDWVRSTAAAAWWKSGRRKA